MSDLRPKLTAFADGLPDGELRTELRALLRRKEVVSRGEDEGQETAEGLAGWFSLRRKSATRAGIKLLGAEDLLRALAELPGDTPVRMLPIASASFTWMVYLANDKVVGITALAE